jgi:hypothetical protein
VLVAPDYVLSAAYCQDAFASGALIVGAFRAGLTVRGATEAIVSETVVHPDFVGTNVANLILMKLTSVVTHAPIVVNANPIDPVGSVTALGFGKTDLLDNSDGRDRRTMLLGICFPVT